MTFHDLYEQYAEDLLRFAYWLCGNLTDAEDITSQTFVRAWAGKAPIRTETVRAYLFAIARNLYRERYRKTNHEERISADLPTTHMSPENSTIINEQVDSLHNHLATIKEIDRAAFILRVQYDMPYAEIARTLNLSLSATKVKVHRVRLKLAQAIKE